MAMLALASSWACTGDTEGKVVGFDATGTKALVRLEHREIPGDPRFAIDLVVVDLVAGREAKRYPILTFADAGDPTIRGANWKAAEAEVVAMGIKIDPAIAPLPLTPGDPVPTVTLPDPAASLRFTHVKRGEGDDGMTWLVALVTRAGAAPRSQDLASWSFYASTNEVYYVQAVVPIPGSPRVLVQIARGCDEPQLHVVPIGPAAGE